MWPRLVRRWLNSAPHTRRHARYRPRLEVMDDRINPGTFTVTSVDDTLAEGTLRWAITKANGNAGPDDIHFNIPGTGVHTIVLGSPLPPVADTAGTTIDGYMEPGSSRNTLAIGDNAKLKVALDGRAAGDADGLVITGGNSRVEGLVIENFRGRLVGGVYTGGSGIRLQEHGNNTIAGNFIGTTTTGRAPAGNGLFGILVISDSPNNTIGGPTPGARNLVSGNDGHAIRLDSVGNVVAGNYVGVNRSGNVALPNYGSGVVVTNEGNTIGGAVPGAGNVLSANRYGSGLTLYNATLGSASPAQTTIQGNLIGLGANGTTPLGNGFYGVYLALDSRNALVGGTEPGARNVISSNIGFGIVLDGLAKATIQGNYIGTDATGMLARGNSFIGVYTSTASDLLIGGAGAGAGNLISGNPTGIALAGANNAVQGNLIGTNRLGTAALPNNYGMLVSGATNAKIGGTDPLARNVISGNRVDGINFDTAATSSNTILGNYIGTDITGARDLGNGRDGVHLQRGTFKNTIGGGVAGAGNVISGNGGSGVLISDGSPDNFVSGNRIGTNAAGDAALGNDTAGVSIVDSDGNLVGGTSPTTVNVISGQYSRVSDRFGVFLGGTSANNRVRGNIIGTNAAGTAALPNGEGVEVRTPIGAANEIGGTDDGAGNLISGNARFGVEEVGGSGLLVRGNVIGLDLALTAPLGNGLAGVFLNEVGGSSVGGAVPGAPNLISGNGAEGVRVRLGSSNSVMGNRIGTDALGTSAIPNSGGVLLEGTDNALVGGSLPDAGNLIAGNTRYGVAIGREAVTGRVGTHNFVAGNLIGTDATGSAALGNGAEGVLISNGARGNLVGGYTPSGRNVISGNVVGVRVTGTGTNVNTIAGNYIGIDATGNVALGNRDTGVLIEEGAQNTLVGGYTVGARNVISGNPLFDVEINGTPTNFNAVAGNYIGLNAGGNASILSSFTGDGIAVFRATGGNTIGGAVPGAGNVISGRGLGVAFGAGARNVTIQGNYIGTDATGTFTVGNNAGIHADNTASDSLIGGGSPLARNIISGNNVGIDLSNSGGFVHNLKIQGNWIGPDAAGGAGAPNGIGIGAGANATTVPTQDISNVAIDSNVISHNGDAGIHFYGQFVRNNIVVGNTITQNGKAGVLLQHGANNNTIGGLTAAARNVISGNVVFGIEINKPADPTVPFIAVTRNTIQGNFIGTDAAGTKPDPNGIGISIRGGTNNLIGGTDKGAANIISANINDGVDILEPTSKGNVLQGNFIGTIAGGGGALGNGVDGVLINVDAAANVIGARAAEPVGSRGNVIAFNGQNGVTIGMIGSGIGLASVGNTIRGNQIFGNGLLGIDLGNDAVTLNDALDADGSPNNLQNFPQLLSAIGDGTTITFTGKLNSNPNEKFVIDVYGTAAGDSSGHGEGKVYLGSVTAVTNAAGQASFSFTAPELAAPGWAISATATRVSTGDTSEFSDNILLT